MNRQIARLGAALLACYLVLFLQLNRLTIFQASDLREDPANSRQLVRDFDAPRGTISTADGVVVAATDRAADTSPFDRQRVYPEGDLFAHVTGYWSLNIGATGLERTYGDELAGETLDLDLSDLSDLFVERERVGNLVLTLRADAQRVAKEQLGDRQGSVVALDPRTGAVLALWSYPSFDPNALASHDAEAANAAKGILDADGRKPLLAKSFRERFFPGSTFKVVTAAAGLESGDVTLDQPSYPVAQTYTPPQTTRPLRNFGGSTCGGPLPEILRVSCNTAFAQMAVDLGPDQMVDTAEDFGFNDSPPLDVPDAAESVFPTEFERDLPKLAQSGIGQNEVQATPLQMAMVAAAVANGGAIMSPHVVAQVRDDRDEVVDEHEPGQWRRAMSEESAAQLRQAMVTVATEGTARNLLVGGLDVGGKTGTAQLGTDPPRSHAWIIGFAGPPGEAPTVAVAVLVEGQAGASEQTGGRVAAPIARAVLEVLAR